MIQNEKEHRLQNGLFFLVPLLLFLAFFYPSFSPHTRFSYRDVAFYYYPLFQQIQHEWEQGRLPLWNPNENLGQPLAADPTSSVFYPVKLLFFLSSLKILSYAACFKLYIWFHVLLMLYLSYKLARRLRLTFTGAIITGIAYTFSGQTLFQYTNVIYLVGSAWAPGLFIYLVDFFNSQTNKQRRGAIIKLSILQAITILGGEPQIVYLTLFVGGVGILFYPFHLLSKTKQIATVSSASTSKSKDSLKIDIHCNRFKSSKLAGVGVESSVNKEKRLSFNNLVDGDGFLRRLFLAAEFVITTGILVFCFAAIQILPSLDLISGSSRTSNNVICSIWEIPRCVCSSKSDHSNATSNAQSINPYNGLLCADFSQNGRSRSIYRFSVGPWRWLEFVFPNINGRQFPQSSRWINIFPEEISVWTPTLYFGIFPFLLALSAIQFRRQRCKRQSDVAFWQIFFTWLVVLSTISALGGFGLVWFLRAFKSLLTHASLSSDFCNYDPIGGLYWLLNVLAPKFSQFRYPAKLMLLAMLGLSCLAGIGWDQKRTSKRFYKTSVSILTLTLLGLILMRLFGRDFLSSLTLNDPLFGKFQADLAYRSICNSFFQTLLVVIISLACLSLLNKSQIAKNNLANYLLTFALLTTTAVDIFYANHWFMVVSPADLFQKESDAIVHIKEERIKELAEQQPKLLNNNKRLLFNSGVLKQDQKFTPNELRHIIPTKKAQDQTLSPCKTLSKQYNAVPPVRYYRFPVWFPIFFQERSSANRNSERVLWDVETLFPKYGSEQGFAALDVRGAVMEKEYEKYVNELIQRENVVSDLNFLDVSYVIGPGSWVYRLLNVPDPNANSEDPMIDMSLTFRKVPGVSVRAAIFRNDRRVDSIFLQNVQNQSYSDCDKPHLPQTADENNLDVNADPQNQFNKDVANSIVTSKEKHNAFVRSCLNDYVETLAYEPNKIYYLISVEQNSEVVFAEQYWKGWKATLASLDQKEAALLRRSKFDTRTIEQTLVLHNNDHVQEKVNISKLSSDTRLLQTKTSTDESVRHSGGPLTNTSLSVNVEEPQRVNVQTASVPVERKFSFLRKIDVPQGLYCVKLEYKPMTFYVGAAITVSCWLLLLVLSLLTRTHKKTTNKTNL